MGTRKRKRRPVSKITKKQIKAVIAGTKETKHNEFTSTSQLTNVAPLAFSINTLTGLIQGTAATERVGISIAPKTLQVNLTMRQLEDISTGASQHAYRFYVYQDVDAAALSMGNVKPTDLWPTQADAENRYKILFNRVMVLDSTKPTRYMRIVIPASKLANKRIQFGPGAGTQNTTSGNIHFVVATNNTQVTPKPVEISYRVQLTYHDA